MSGKDATFLLPLLAVAAPVALPALAGAMGIGAAAGTAAAATVPASLTTGLGGALAGTSAGTVGLAADAMVLSAAGGGLFSGLTTSAVLSTGLSAAAGLSTMAAGNAEAAGFEDQARGREMQARSASLEGRRKAIEALSEANDLAARRAVVFGTRGIGREGTPEVSQMLDRERQRSNLQLTRLGGAATSLGFQAQGQALQRQARSARRAGFIGGLTKFGKGAINLTER